MLLQRYLLERGKERFCSGARQVLTMPKGKEQNRESTTTRPTHISRRDCLECSLFTRQPVERKENTHHIKPTSQHRGNPNKNTSYNNTNTNNGRAIQQQLHTRTNPVINIGFAIICIIFQWMSAEGMNVGGVHRHNKGLKNVQSSRPHVISTPHLNTVHITIHNLQATSLLTKMSIKILLAGQ